MTDASPSIPPPGASRTIGAPRGVTGSVIGDVVVLAAVVCFFFVAYIIRDYFVDDAYIGLTYVRNLLAGHGLVFFPGHQPVEGVTNIGWLLLLAPVALVAGPTTAAKVLSLILALAAFSLTLRLGLRLSARVDPALRSGVVAVVPALLLMAHFDFLYFTLSGMETGLLATLLLAMAWLALRQPTSLLLPVLGAAAFLVHPEAVLVYPMFALLLWHAREFGIRRMITGQLVLAVLVGAATLVRYAYFGELVPNTFFAKTGGLSWMIFNGLNFVSGQNINLPFPVSNLFSLPIIAFGYLRLRHAAPSAANMLLAITTTGLIFCLYSRPDWTLTGRYFGPYLPAALILLWIGLVEGVRAVFKLAADRMALHVGAGAVAGLMVIAGVFAGMLKFEQIEEFPGYVLASRNLVAPAIWIRDHVPSGATVASQRIGALSYYSERPVFDYKFGLTDRDVARQTNSAGHLFFDPNDPALADLWRLRAPDYLLEEPHWIDQIAKAAKGNRESFVIHGMEYQVIKQFEIGRRSSWLLAKRRDPD